MVAGPTAEARTEAGLTGAAGAIRTAAVSTEAEAGRVTRMEAADTLARVGQVAAAVDTSSAVAQDGAAVDSVQVAAAVGLPVADHPDRQPWPVPGAGERLEAAATVAACTAVGRREHREGIRRVRMEVGATAAHPTATAGPATATARTAAMVGRVMAMADRTETTVATTVHRDQAESAPMPGTTAGLARARVEATRAPTRTPVRGTAAAVTALGELPDTAAAAPTTLTLDTIRIARPARSAISTAAPTLPAAEIGVAAAHLHAALTTRAIRAQFRMTQIVPADAR
jgi:hypothetical protein